MLLILEQKLEALEKERCNLKEEVDEGRHQMQAMKETTMKSKEKLQTANSKLQFEMAESSRVAAERLNEVMRMKLLLEEKKEGGDEVVAVAAVKVELAKKEEEVADLKQLLEEASVEFLMLGGANDRLEEKMLAPQEERGILPAEKSSSGGRGGSPQGRRCK